MFGRQETVTGQDDRRKENTIEQNRLRILNERSNLIEEFINNYIRDPFTKNYRVGIQQKHYSDSSVYEGEV